MELKSLGLEIVERIGADDERLYFRVLDEAGAPCQAIVLAPAMQTEFHRRRFRQEFELMQRLRGAQIPHDLKWLSSEQLSAIRCAGNDGRSLRSCLADGPLPLSQALTIGCEICAGLEVIHAQGLVHRQISLDHVLWSAARQSLQICNFSRARTSFEEQGDGTRAEALQGDLHYLAPELTGRLNLVPDGRADLYALGVVLYWLLSGQPPFSAADKLGMVHAHLALQAKPLHQLNEAVPVQVALLVARLLNKSPDQRYQSAWGVQSDLRRCLSALAQGVAVPAFELGKLDFSQQIHAPRQLYGRGSQLQQLQDALHATRAGAACALTLRGYSGIGKSALEQQLRDYAKGSTDVFVRGKVDQFQHGTPYAALSQAFNALLVTPQDGTDLYATLASELLPFVHVLVPALAEHTGLPVQPMPEGVAAAESKARFLKAATAFLQLHLRPSHALVMFIDDLQWADRATLELLEQLLLADDLGGLMVLAAYRDNEVDANHPLARVLKHVSAAGRPPTELLLGPLSRDDILAWLVDSLGGTPAHLQPLAAIVLNKTAGNPFFVHRFLHHAQQKRWLYPDLESHCWAWNAQALRDSAVMDNVVDLLLDEIALLTPEEQRILGTCALVGAQFDVLEIVTLSGGDISSLVRAAERAAQLGFLVSRGESRFAFAHDRIQEAASRTLDAPAKQQLHREIGQRLLESLSPEQQEARLFEIIAHLTPSAHEHTSDAQRERFCRLVVRAAKRARLANAATAGLAPVILACDRYGEPLWDADPALARQLVQEGQRLAFQCSDFEHATAYFTVLKQHLSEPQDLLVSHVLMVNQLTMRGQYKAAIDLALQCLHVLGFELRQDHLLADAQAEMANYQDQLARTGYAQILAWPPRQDAHAEAVLMLVKAMSPATFFGLPAMIPLLALKTSNFCLRQQYAQGAGFLFPILSYAYIGLANDYRSGFEVVDFALKLSEQQRKMDTYAEGAHVMGLSTAHWVLPLAKCLYYPRRAFELGCEYGALQVAGYSFFSTLALRFEQGQALAEVEQELQAAFTYVRKTRNLHAELCFLSYRQLFRALKGETLQRTSFDDADFQEAEHLQSLKQNQMALCYFHVYKLVLASYADAPQLALAQARLAAPLVGYIMGFLAVGTFHFHAALAYCRALETAQVDERDTLLTELDASADLLANWACSAPDTFAHRVSLVAAERARLGGDPWQALQHYESAIAGAKASGFVHEEGLACRLGAALGRSHGLAHQASSLLRRARECFVRWGALALLPDVASDAKASPGAELGANLDFDSVLKSAEAIGGELKYQDLLKKLVFVALENAGAQCAMLLCTNAEGVQTPEAWVALVEGELVYATAEQSEPTPAFVTPTRLIADVARRGQSVVIHDASKDERTATSPVLNVRRVRSLLCLPLLRENQVLGCIYLENNLAAGMFTQRQVRVLQLIAGQAAIALESARLYRNLEQQVEQRTAQLKATQAELAEAGKMAALGGLVAGIAHEINTPIGLGLTGITHFKHMIRGVEEKFRAEDLDEAQFERFITDSNLLSDTIVTSLERAAALVRSFKLVAVDQTHDEFRRFNFSDYVSDIVLTHKQVLAKAQVKFKLDCPSDLEVDSYAGAWSQILSNLLTNSVVHGFSPPPQAPCVSVSVSLQGSEMCFRYQDNGKGMRQAVAEKVYEPFFTTNRQEGGSGLGMNIVYNLVTQKLGGNIQLTTAPDKGVQFVVNAPLTAPHVPTINPAG